MQTIVLVVVAVSLNLWFRLLSVFKVLDTLLYSVRGGESREQLKARASEEEEGPWRHGFVQSNGVQLHYVESGERSEGKELMLCVHGFPEFWYSWRHQLREFQDRFHVVAIDQRGYNLSEKPAARAAYRRDELVADLVGVVGALGYKSAVLLSHDWGGAVAWVAAARHPEVFSRLVVMNCPHPGNMSVALRRNEVQQRRSWYMFAFQLPFVPERFMSRNVSRIFANSMRNRDQFSRDDERAFARAAAQPGAMCAAVNYYRANLFDPANTAAAARLPKLRVPTLLLWGQDDEALGQELTHNTDRHFEDAKQFHLKLVPRCSHWTQQDQPELVNIILTKWLNDY